MPHPLRIQRKRTKGFRLPSGAICVTRPGKWGNPFPGSATLFHAWLTGTWIPPQHEKLMARRLWMLDHLHELAGKQLACWCSRDAACHADLLCELANATEGKNEIHHQRS